MKKKQSYADYLTEQRSRQKTEGKEFVKCADCTRLVRNRCEKYDRKPNQKAPRICRHFEKVKAE